MTLPLSLLPHTVTVTTPGTVTDAYGQPSASWTTGTATRTLRGYVQPLKGDEYTNGRQAVTYTHRLFSNEPVEASERVTWQGQVFEVDGPSLRWDLPSGATNHYVTPLRVTEG